MGENEAVEAKIVKFPQKGVLWTDSCLKWDPCELQERAWRGGLQGRTSPYPLSRSVPPPPRWILAKQFYLLSVHCVCPTQAVVKTKQNSPKPNNFSETFVTGDDEKEKSDLYLSNLTEVLVFNAKYGLTQNCIV